MYPLINRDNTCCFTGHRPSKLPWRHDEYDPRCILLKEKLYDIVSALYKSGIHHFICGMAQGCDTYFTELLFGLREEHRDITVEAALPCETQSALWSETDRSRYFRMIADCDYETLIQRSYTNDCMIKRNKYMVDNSSVLIAVYNGTLGGTMQTINYAKKKGLEIIELKP